MGMMLRWVRALRSCTFESGCTYTTIVYLTVGPAIVSMSYTAPFGRFRYVTGQDRSSKLTIK
jgi:hypothetical protein